jgi:hypothetical protein
MSNRGRRAKRLAGSFAVLAMLATFVPIVALASAASAAPPPVQDITAFCAGGPTGNPFPDVPSGDAFFDEISCAKDAGVVNGKTDGNFHENDGASRAQESSIAARQADEMVSLAAAGQTLTPLPAPGSNPFSDVGDPPSNGGPSTAPHTDNILRLNAAGIVSGKTATTFDPAGGITRFQFVKIEVLKLEFVTGTTLDDTCGATYADGAENDATFGDFVKKATCAGIIQGKAGNVFDGTAFQTRGQTAAETMRGMAWANGMGFITVLHPTTAAGYTIDPSGPALLTASTAPGTANGNRASRTFTVTGIPNSDSPVDVALIPSTSVQINGSQVLFRDTDVGVAQAGRADALGATGCRIDSINGVNRGVTDGTPGVITDNSDYADNIAVTNGTLTLTTNCQNSNQAFYVVVFKDADNNNQLNLDNTDPTANFKPASETFGISGITLVIPPEAAFGAVTDRMAIVVGLVNLFTTAGPPLSGNPAQSFFVQDGDDLRYQSGNAFPAPGQVLSKAQFFDYASGIVSGNREDIGGPNRFVAVPTAGSNDAIVLGDGFTANYVPQGQTGNSAISITNDVPAAVTDVTATAADTDQNGLNDNVTVGFNRPINPDINHFNIYRGTVNTGNGQIPTTAPGNFALVGVVPAVAGQTAYTFNDEDPALVAQPGLKFGYIVLAVNGPPNSNVGPDSNTGFVTMPIVANTKTPAIAASQFTNGTNVGNNPAAVDAQDAFQLTLVNGPVTAAAGASFDGRDDDGDLFRVICGTNATCGVSGAGQNIVTFQMTGPAQLVQTGTGGGVAPNVNGTFDAPTGGSTIEIVASSGITNANGGLNLAESGLGGAGGSPVDAGLTQPPATRVRLFGSAVNDPLPNAPTTADVTADPANDRVTVANTVVGPANGDTLNLYNGAGVLIGTAVENHASPGGTVINASPGFNAGDRLYLTYTQATNPKLESETLKVNNPTDKPVVTTVTANNVPPATTTKTLKVNWSESVTQTGPPSNYQVFDAANSVLLATGTAVNGSPCGPNPTPCTLTITLDNAIANGAGYRLRVAANTVQDVNNLPNDAQVVVFSVTAADVTPPSVASSTQNEGDSFFRVTFTEPVTGVQPADFFTTGGNSVTGVSAGPGVNEFTVTTASPLASGQGIGVSASSVQDASGNSGPPTAYTAPVTNNSSPFATASVVTTDARTNQPLPSGTLTPATTGDSKIGQSDVLRVTFNEPMDTTSVPPGGSGITLACGDILGVPAGEVTYTWLNPTQLQITINNALSVCDGQQYPETIASFPATIKDLAGNPATTSPAIGTPDNVFDDPSGPYIISDTAAAAVTEFRITFNEPVNCTDAQNTAKYAATTDGTAPTTVLSATCESSTVVRIDVGSPLAANATISTISIRDANSISASHNNYVLV